MFCKEHYKTKQVMKTEEVKEFVFTFNEEEAVLLLQLTGTVIGYGRMRDFTDRIFMNLKKHFNAEHLCKDINNRGILPGDNELTYKGS